MMMQARRGGALLGCLLGTLVVLAPAVSARAEMDVRPPQAARLRVTPDALEVALPAVLGGVLFLGGYAVTAITTSAWHLEGRECFRPYGLAGGWACEERGPSGDTALASLIPLVGPWVMLNTPGVDEGFAVAMGLTQLAGVLTVAIGVPLAIRSGRSSISAGVITEHGGARLVIGGAF